MPRSVIFDGELIDAKKIAAEAGVCYSYLCRVLKGRQKPSNNLMDAVCPVMGFVTKRGRPSYDQFLEAIEDRRSASGTSPK